MEEIKKTEGYVALLDVLGFRELVNRDDKLSEIKKYIHTVESLFENNHKYDSLQYLLFSDNLIINTKTNSDDDFHNLVKACSSLLFDLLQLQIAVRGVVSYGSFLRSPTTRKGVILAGKPIVEADHYQHIQNWVGTILAPSVIKFYNNIKPHSTITPFNPGENRNQWLQRQPLAINIKHWGGIPFHTESSNIHSTYEGYVLVPMHADASTREAIFSSLDSTIENLEIMKSQSPDPSTQFKYTHSNDFLRFVKQSWNLMHL